MTRWKGWLLPVLSLLALSCLPGCMASVDSSTQDASGQDSHIQVSHDVADALVEALAEASSPIHSKRAPATPESTPPNGKLFQRWTKGIRSFLTTPWSFAGSNSTQGKDNNTTDATNKNDAPTRPSRPEKAKKNPNHQTTLSRRFRAFEAFRFTNKMDMQETLAGARLLSGSFQLVSTTAGLVADSVRVAGNTAAGIMGSSVKVTGTAVKSVGAGFIMVSRGMEKKPAIDLPSSRSGGTPPAFQDNDATNKQDEPQSIPTKDKRNNTKQEGPFFLKRSKQAAAKSLRFMGGVVNLAGESILIAGAGLESLASSTTGVAEETVRVLEELAQTVSIAISLRGRKRALQKDASSLQNDNETTRSLLPPFLSFGTFQDPANNDAETKDALLTKLQCHFYDEPPVENAMLLGEFLASSLAQFAKDVSAEVEGVSSMAHELAAALFFCHLLAVLLLYQRPSERREAEAKELKPKDKRRTTKREDKEEEYVWVTFPSSKGEDKNASKPTPNEVTKKTYMSSVQKGLRFLIRLPWIVSCWSCQCVLRFVFSRRMVLLGLYSLVWTYLSRLSQQRLSAVQRRAKAVGFRNGLASVAESSPPTETLLWLNHVLTNLWRVKDLHSEKSSPPFPPFVNRALQTSSGESYGGLEPYISSAIGNGLVNGLEAAKAMRPTDVAYVSLFSLSLGRRPPVIKSIKLGNEIVKGDSANSQIELDLEVEALLEDLSIVFEVKLSSLSYALLPSTKIRLFNLDFRASIKALLVLTPQFPFVSEVKLSMSTHPHCDFRAAPMSTDSQNGVELGSIPFLNDWIQESIRSTLSTYVSPRFIAINVFEILRSRKQDQADVVPNLDSLRRHTQYPISSPRTSISDGVAITSVADHLEAGHSSQQAAGKSPKRTVRKRKPLLRPVTELSRLALERHEIRHTCCNKQYQENLVRPVTELARLGMDRWLDSAVTTKR